MVKKTVEKHEDEYIHINKDVIFTARVFLGVFSFIFSLLAIVVGIGLMFGDIVLVSTNNPDIIVELVGFTITYVALYNFCGIAKRMIEAVKKMREDAKNDRRNRNKK